MLHLPVLLGNGEVAVTQGALQGHRPPSIPAAQGLESGRRGDRELQGSSEEPCWGRTGVLENPACRMEALSRGHGRR